MALNNGLPAYFSRLRAPCLAENGCNGFSDSPALLGGRYDIIHAEVSILRIALFPLLKIYLAARKMLPHFARGPGKLTLWSQW